MSAAGVLIRCHCCEESCPASETFEPYHGAVRCKDAVACERRQVRRYDPTIVPDEDLPRPPTATAPHGTTCAVCGAARSAAALYDRGHGQWFCRDRAACDWTAGTDMAAVREDFTDFVITSAQMRAVALADVAQVAGTVPTDVTVASQAAASADYTYALAASGRRR